MSIMPQDNNVLKKYGHDIINWGIFIDKEIRKKELMVV